MRPDGCVWHIATARQVAITVANGGRTDIGQGARNNAIDPKQTLSVPDGHGIVRVVGVFIALVVSTNVTHTWYWRGAIFLGVLAVYWLTVWLLQLGWSRYRAPQIRGGASV
jgi:hypothetical protein